MAVNWGLAAQPVNPLQALQAFGMAQQQQEARAKAEQDRVYREREYALKDRAASLQERKFTDEQRNAALGQVAQAAQDVLRRPEGERAAVWDSYMDQFAQTDPSVAQFKGKYSEQAARAILARTGDLEKFNKAGEVDYQVIPQGGRLQGFQFGRPLGGGQEAPAAAPSGGPAPGTIEDGYRFKGGNPADQSSWEPVGGQTPQASGGFPGPAR